MADKLKVKMHSAIFVIAFLCHTFLPEKASASYKVNADTLGIPISSNTFDSLAYSTYSEFKESDSSATIEDYLLFIRIWDTIGFDNQMLRYRRGYPSIQRNMTFNLVAGELKIIAIV